MKTVRLGTFETNSSSMHAIIIPEHSSNVYKHLKDIVFQYNMDFSERALYVRNKPEEKASYVFQLIVGQINSYFVPVTKDGVEIPGAVTHNERVIKVFTDWMEQFKAEVLEWEKINVSFSGYVISREYTNYKGEVIRQYHIQEPEGTYASTGCYGHKGVNGVLLSRLFDRFDKIVENIDSPDWDKPEEIEKRNKNWDASMFHIIDFVFDPNAVIIQYTDEYSGEGLAEMKQKIREYMEMNDYRCNLIWPIGG